MANVKSVQSQWLDLDAEVFRTAFNRQPFVIGHRLTNHPLFTLPRLVELAQRLPAEQVEYNSGRIPLAPGWTLRRFETSTRTNWHYECANAFVDGELQASIGS